MTYFIATLLKPFVILVLSAIVLVPARMAVKRHMEEGPVKDILLFRISGEKWTWKLALFWASFLLLFFYALFHFTILSQQ